MEIRAKLTQGAFWLLAARLMTNVVALLSTFMLARFLVPDDFGLVAIAMTVFIIISAVTELSLSAALIHHPDPTEAHFNTAWTLNFLRAALLGSLVAGLAAPMAWFYGEPRLLNIMLVIGVITFFGGLGNPKFILFNRRLSFMQESILQVLQKAAVVLTAVAIAAIFQSYWAIVAGLAAGQAVWLLFSYVMMPFMPRPSFTHWRELLSYSAWLSLAQAITTISWKMDHLITGYVLGNTPLGYFTVAENLAIIPTREVTAPVGQTLFPAFSRIGDDHNRLRAAYLRAQSLLCAMAFPAGFGIALIAAPLVLLAMGEKWAPAIPLIQLLAVNYAVQTLGAPLQPLAMAMGRTRSLFRRDVLNFCLHIPFLAAGLYFGGLIGVVLARCASDVVGTLINMLMTRRYIDISLTHQFSANWRTIAATSTMALILLFFLSSAGTNATYSYFELFSLVAAGAITHLTMNVLLWFMSGRPPGPEQEILSIATKFIKKAASSRASRQSAGE